MIDTLMAFWNQNRRKRVAQVLLTFLLMCISISLLFVAMSLPQWSHTQQQANMPLGTQQPGQGGHVGQIGQATTTPTVIVGNTVGPSMTPTSTVVIPGQVTATPGSGASSCVTPNAQVYSTSISYTHGTPRQATPSLTGSVTVTGTPNPDIPGRTQDGGGPIFGTPIPSSTSGIGEPGGMNAPDPTAEATGTPQPVGGWTTPCTGNNIGIASGPDVVAIVWQNIWGILGISLACTAVFYAALWVMGKRR